MEVKKGINIEDKEKLMLLLKQNYISVEDRLYIFDVHHILGDIVVYSCSKHCVTDVCDADQCYVLNNEELQTYNDLLVKGYMLEGGEALYRAFIQDKLDKFESPLELLQ
jgi:hypothetical protein